MNEGLRNDYNNDGDLAKWKLYKYDEDENIIEYNQYNPDNELLFKNKWEVDKYGNDIKEYQLYTKKFPYRNTQRETMNSYVYKYDEYKNWIEKISYENGEISYFFTGNMMWML